MTVSDKVREATLKNRVNDYIDKQDILGKRQRSFGEAISGLTNVKIRFNM